MIGFVKIIRTENLFLTLPFKDSLVFLNFFLIVPTSIVHMIIVEIVFLVVWYESWFDSLCLERLPVEICKPGVGLYLSASMHSKSLCRLSHKTLIYKVCCFFGIAFRDVFISYLRLLVQYGVSHLFTTSTDVWSAPHNAFVSYNTNCEVISCYSVILLEHHLWCHVPRCARVLCIIYGNPFLSNTKVSKPKISIGIEN